MRKRIEFFLYPKVLALDVTGPSDVFHAANEILAGNGSVGEGYELVFSAESPGVIATSSGLCFYADQRLGAKDSDTLLLPGGVSSEQLAHDEHAINSIRLAASKAQRVVSVCTGAFLLAATGLLDGRRATTHWREVTHFAQCYPSVNVDPDAIYVQDGNLATSGGVTAGIDLALALLEDDYGSDMAAKVARLLLLYRRRAGYQSQFSTTLAVQAQAGKRFSKLVDWIDKHLCENLTVDVLAQQVHMSPRTFSRVFSSETGCSPGRFVEQLRIERARELLESGAKGLSYIASESGFAREERLRRAFQRKFGISPLLYQEHFLRSASVAESQTDSCEIPSFTTSCQ